jgi:hypothetical protein
MGVAPQEGRCRSPAEPFHAPTLRCAQDGAPTIGVGYELKRYNRLLYVYFLQYMIGIISKQKNTT